MAWAELEAERNFCGQPSSPCANKRPRTAVLPRALRAAGGGAAVRRPRPPPPLRAPSSAAFWIAALFLATNAHLAYWLSRAPPPPPPAPLPAVVVTGQRIPRTFFRTRGAGQSGVGIETGSFDAALYNASIADQNIDKYTSVLPAESVEMPRNATAHRHGAVLESIVAQCDGYAGESLTAGIATARLRRKLDGVAIGGFVVEYPSSAAGVPGTAREGVNVTRAQAEQNLADAKVGLFERRYGADWAASLEAYDQWSEVHQINVTEPFGTVLVGIGFADYSWPLSRMARRRRWWARRTGRRGPAAPRLCATAAGAVGEACLPPGPRTTPMYY